MAESSARSDSTLIFGPNGEAIGTDSTLLIVIVVVAGLVALGVGGLVLFLIFKLLGRKS